MARPRNQAEQKCLSDGRWDARWRDRHIRAVAADVKLRILYESIPPSRALACKTRLFPALRMNLRQSDIRLSRRKKGLDAPRAAGETHGPSGPS